MTQTQRDSGEPRIVAECFTCPCPSRKGNFCHSRQVYDAEIEVCRAAGHDVRPVGEPRIVAECLTCPEHAYDVGVLGSGGDCMMMGMHRAGMLHRMTLEVLGAERHRAAGHDVRNVTR